MRVSAPQATEYRTNLNALPFIGSIRLVKRPICIWPNLGREFVLIALALAPMGAGFPRAAQPLDQS